MNSLCLLNSLINQPNKVSSTPTVANNLIFWLQGGTATVPTIDNTNTYAITNNGSVVMYNDATMGYVFSLSGSNYLSMSVPTTVSATRIFWVSSSTPFLDLGNVLSSNYWPCFFQNTSTMYSGAAWGSASYAVSSYTQNTVWAFYAITVSSSNVSIYVNGAYNSNVATVNWTGDTTTLQLGAFTGSYYYTGYAMDIRQYNIALNPPEIASIYTSSQANTSNSCVFFNTNGYILANTLGSGLQSSTTWTIECWCYYPAIPTSFNTLFSVDPYNSTTNTNGTLVLGVQNNSGTANICIYVGDGAVGNQNIISNLNGSISISANNWHHIALTYSSSSGYAIWQDGNKVASSATTTSISYSLNKLRIGAQWYSTTVAIGNFATNCNIGMVRMSYNQRYTSSFTPSANYSVDANTFYFFSCRGYNGSTGFPGQIYNGYANNTFNSANASIITANYPPLITSNSSVFFNGFATVTFAYGTTLGSGMTGATKWTMEGWCYFNELWTTPQATIFSCGPSPTYMPVGLFASYLSGTTWCLTLYVSDGSTSTTNIINGYTVTSSYPLTLGWHHFAVTYDSTVGYKIWQDGTNVYTNGTTTNMSSKITSFMVGTSLQSATGWYGPNANGYFGMGKISNTVVYTSSFTPNTSYGVDANTFYYFPYIGYNTSTVYTSTVYSGLPTTTFTSANTYLSTRNYPRYSPTSWSLSNMGSVVISTAQSKSGMSSTSSLYLPGTTQPNRSVMSNFPASTRLTGDWTIEYFVYVPSGYSASEGAPVSIGNTTTLMIYTPFLSGTGRTAWYVGTLGLGNWEVFNGTDTAYTSAAWNHVALTYNSANNNYQAFNNGTRTGANTSVTSMNTKLTQWAFGTRLLSSTYSLGGGGLYVDAVRVSSNVRYNTSTYTVPSTAYGYDSNTIYINYFEGTNNSLNMTFGEYYYS